MRAWQAGVAACTERRRQGAAMHQCRQQHGSAANSCALHPQEAPHNSPADVQGKLNKHGAGKRAQRRAWRGVARDEGQ